MNQITKCPDCGSDRITRLSTYECVIGRNVKTGKIIYRDKRPEHGYPTLWSYRCRKCGWDSECFVD
jgi:predicted RNA-binding Zn-ribbon protein involved in translation (DUF1610 family)